MTKVSLDYIAGLYDGDGSFYVSVSKHPNIPIGYQITPAIILSLSEYDSVIFNDIVDTFPNLRFRTDRTKYGNINLTLKKEKDVLVFLRILRPRLKIFTNVKRAMLVEEIARKLATQPYRKGSDRSSLYVTLIKLVKEIRKYSKKGRKARKNIVVDKNVNELVEESKSYTCRELTVDYIAGLFDAEGYAGIYIQKSPRSRFGYYPRPVVNLNLAIYDAGVLYKMKEMFDELKPQIKLRKSNNTAYFQISGLGNVKEFLETIFPHSKLPSVKRKLKLTLEAIQLMENKEHYTENGWNKLLGIVKNIRNISKRNGCGDRL